MKFDTNAQKAIQTFVDNPTDQRAVYGLGTLYWSTFISSIGEIIHNDGDVFRFVENEKFFLNVGVIDKILENSDEIKSLIKNNTITFTSMHIFTVVDWLLEILHKIKSGDKKDVLEREIKNLEIEQREVDEEISTIQQSRKNFLIKELSAVSDKSISAQIENLSNLDFLNLQNMQTKSSVAKGTFFSIEERRGFANQSGKLQKELAKAENLFSCVKSSEGKIKLRKDNTRISQLFVISIKCTDDITKKEIELDKIDKIQSSISPIEMENRIKSEIEYLRDMVKLSAKRLHMESCPILRQNSKYFTQKELANCLDRILEFDPRVFKNDRVPLFGNPSVLLVPGNGNGLYDWKNNRIVIPTIPPNGNFMSSIATAVIEYRLDVDEDKKLLTSYQKLPAMKNVKSIITLRETLTRDYIKWMTSEYQGFKVLEKESRIWFEREIAPNRNEIFCPPQYQPSSLSSKEFRILMEDVESKLSSDSSVQNINNIWAASILNYQQGDFVKSIKYLNTLLTLNPEHIFGYYNLGIVGMKIPQKQDAIRGFNEFSKRKPQSWWATVARDHVRRLQIS